MLKGKKVNLRAVRKSDIEYFLKWFNDREVTQYTFQYLPLTEIAEEKWINELNNEPSKYDNIIFMVEAIDKGRPEPIGDCGLLGIDHRNQFATFAIAIGDKDFWGNGYGTEAAELIIEYGFNQLNLNRISSSAFSVNKRSLGLHKKVGFQEEGCRRKIFFVNGEFCNEVIFGLLRKDWRK